MTNILVLSAPAKEDSLMPMLNAGMGSISGWLKSNGYSFDQRSLLVECRYYNRYRWKNDYIDLSVFEEEKVIEYLRGSENQEITEETEKMAGLVDIENYDIILVSFKSDESLAMGLPLLKEYASDKLVVIGGPCTMTNELEIARLDFIDYGVVGDGELPILNILEHELENHRLKNTGLVYTENNELIRGDPYRHPIEMKAKPYYNPDILDKMEKLSITGESIIPYKLSRGCTQNCSFCNYFENQKYEYKSVEKIVREVEELKKETGRSLFYFTDSNMFNDPSHIAEMAENFSQNNTQIKWGGMSIILPRSKDFFETLNKGGCTMLMHGIESASNSVLHRMHKAQTQEMIRKTLEKEKDAGITPFGFFICNYVNETIEEYYETLDFIRDNDSLAGSNISYLVITEEGNMPLYSNAEELGITLIENETDDFIEECLTSRVEFEDDINLSEEVKKLKRSNMQKKADFYNFTLNYGLEHPIIFSKKYLRKMVTKDYLDYTWLYV